MLTGITALMSRSLRIDSRSWQTHLTRLVLLIGIYIALACVLMVSRNYAAPGLMFFRSSVWLNMIMLTLLGIGSFSTTITEEKEEDTLGLMLMAGINPAGLLFGKLAGRLSQALLLVIIQYPLTLLAVTMGGVMPIQVQAAYLGIVSYMVMLAGAGLLCSTLAPRSRTAGKWMVISLLVYASVPLLCREIWMYLGFNRWGSSTSIGYALQVCMSSSLFIQVESILTTGFNESPWSLQVISNFAVGIACFLLSWGLFGVATRTVSSEADARGALSRSKRGLARSFNPGRVWDNPLIWKDFYFVAGGLSMRVVRFVLYAGLFVFSFGLATLWGMTNQMREILGIYQFFIMFALSWETSLLTARCVQDEVRGQTIAALVMLPQSTASLFYSKLAGTMLGAYPSFLCFIVANLVGIQNTEEFIRHTPVLFFIAHFMLVPHLSAVYALWVRWGAVPLAIGSMIGLFVLEVVIGEWLFRFHDDDFLVLGLLVLGVCAACHWIVLWRIRQLAEQG
jgi:ABC-type transport system involved in multi-copper enzyme maturation permease subunit